MLSRRLSRDISSFTVRAVAVAAVAGAAMGGHAAFASPVCTAATCVEDVPLGPQSKPFDISVYAAEYPANANDVAISVDNNGLTSNLGFVSKSSHVDFQYDFSLTYSSAKPPYVDLTLTPQTGETYSSVSSFDIVDKTTSQTISGVTWNGSTTLSGFIPLADYHDQLALELTLKPNSNVTYTVTGSVPVPGALPLFASSLLVVGFIAARSRNRRGAGGTYA